VGEELVHVRDEPKRLAQLRLALLLDEPDVVPVFVLDLELVGQLDELCFLADHQAV
jgi:hypothetical protein